MKRVSVDIDGQNQVGVVARGPDGTSWFHLNGRTFSLPAANRARRSGSKRAGETSDPLKICAPMPGKINALKVSAGAAVAAGDVLLVMEAMKMEYTIKSAIDGIVAEVLCAQAQQVELGQVLARLEAK